MKRPKQINGASLKDEFRARLIARYPDAAVAKIAPALAGLAVPIDGLTLDPDNARLHPEDNIEAIMESLACYGQRKASVTCDRRGGKIIVVTGNGTVTAARRLGWREIAAVIHEGWDTKEAIGFGIADNRTGESSRWDFATVKRLEALIGDLVKPGWTAEDLARVRAEGAGVEPPDGFVEVGENVEIEHVCPRCGYGFSGGETREKS